MLFYYSSSYHAKENNVKRYAWFIISYKTCQHVILSFKHSLKQFIYVLQNEKRKSKSSRNNVTLQI